MSRYKDLKKEILSNKSCPKLLSQDKVIHININNASEIISPYAEDNRVVINSEFANFLENSVKDLSIKQDLTLEISSKESNLDVISTAIKNYYYNEFIDSERKLKRNLIFSISTFIIGLIALACSIAFNVFETQLLLGGAIDIFAWVFVWESVDLLFFQRAEIKYQQCRQLNFIKSKIILK